MAGKDEKREMTVIVKAKELAVHTFKLTSNSDRYPKKYRHSLVDRMQLKSLDIYEKLMDLGKTIFHTAIVTNSGLQWMKK